MDNHVKPYLGEKLLIKLTSDDLRELYQLLLERGRKLPRQNCGPGLAPATVRGIHTTLHHALKTAADEGLIPFNPAEKVTPPSVPNTPKRVLTHDQLEKFLNSIRPHLARLLLYRADHRPAPGRAVRPKMGGF